MGMTILCLMVILILMYLPVLESESNVLINWFKVNKMQANPDKFQVLAVGKKTFDKNMKICIQNSTLSCEETVKLLGI